MKIEIDSRALHTKEDDKMEKTTHEEEKYVLIYRNGFGDCDTK